MTITAAIDARGAYPAIVILQDSRVLFAGSIQLAEFEVIPGRVAGVEKDKRIIVTDDRIAWCINHISDLLAARAVKRVIVEKPSTRPYSCELVGALRTVINNSEIVETEWPARKGCGRLLDGWPTFDRRTNHVRPEWSEGDYPGTNSAAWIYLCDRDAGSVRGLEGLAPVPPEVIAGIESARTRPLVDLGSFAPSDAPLTARVLGIDPGGHVGLCLAEPLPDGRLRRVWSRVIDVDSGDALVRRDFVEGLAKLILDERVTRVVIERVQGGVYAGNDSENMERSLATLRAISGQLAQANWLGGMVEGMCLAAPVPIEVVTAPASHWRRRLMGGATTPGDDVVQAKVAEMVEGWPVRSTTHERDAAGILVWDALGQVAPAPRKRAPGASRGASKRKQGCTCPPRHKGAHVRGCPIGRVSGTVQKCRVCGQPRRGHVCTGQVTGTSADVSGRK